MERSLPLPLCFNKTSFYSVWIIYDHILSSAIQKRKYCKRVKGSIYYLRSVDYSCYLLVCNRDTDMEQCSGKRRIRHATKP